MTNRNIILNESVKLDHAGSGSILSLAFRPRVPLINATPIRVYYAQSKDASDAPRSFEREEAIWKSRVSDGNCVTTIELLNRLQSAPVEGTRLIEFVQCDGVSMWQFLPSYFWLQFFLAVQLIDIVKRIVDDVNPGKIRIFPNDDPTWPIWHGVVRAVATTRGIPEVVVHQTSISGFVLFLKNSLREIGMKGLARRVARRSKSKRTSLFSEQSSHESTNAQPPSRKILFLTLGKRHWVSVPGEVDKRYDEQMYPLLPALRNAGWGKFVMVDCLNLSMTELVKRMHDGEAGVSWRNFAYYKDNRIIANKTTTFARMWKVLQRDAEFIRDFQYEGVPLMPALRRFLENAFLNLLPECAEMLATAARMLEEERPDAVIATYESGPWERAVIVQAARMSIPTIGLQHGMIFDNHSDYMHLNITTDPSNSGFVVPNVTCVWGPFWKEVLTKSGHYPDESVVVTGDWRYDFLSKLDVGAFAHRVRRNHGVHAKQKVVLILSSGMGTVDYLRACISLIRDRKELSPIIKLHPGVDRLGPVVDLLKELRYSQDLVVSGQLFNAIAVSDLVISQVSTAIGEAALLDKPVILVNFQNADGVKEYVKSGICLYATDSHQLSDAIERALYDKTTRTRLEVARRDFVSRHFFRLDGSSAQRVAQVLLGLARGRRVA